MAVENQNEVQPEEMRTPFTDEQKDKIQMFVGKLYSREGFKQAQGFTDVDEKWARDSLELMGCDLTRADALAMADLSIGQYADMIIMKGRAPESQTAETE